MSHEEVPLARRLRRPSWRDPRLGVGILLIVGSVALGGWAVRDASATVDVFVARQTLTPGTALGEEALVVLQARLPGPAERYVRVEDGLPAEAVATRVIGEGEVVPTAAVGLATDVGLRPVVVPVSAALPGGLAPGAVVDLWFTATTDDGAGPAQPQVLATELVLAEVVTQESVFAGGTGTSVELLVPAGEVGAVLAALAEDGELVVVPVPGGQVSGGP